MEPKQIYRMTTEELKEEHNRLRREIDNVAREIQQANRKLIGIVQRQQTVGEILLVKTEQAIQAQGDKPDGD